MYSSILLQASLTFHDMAQIPSGKHLGEVATDCIRDKFVFWGDMRMIYPFNQPRILTHLRNGGSVPRAVVRHA